MKEKHCWAVCLGCICSARELSTFHIQLITIILSYFYSLSAEKNLHSQHLAVVEQLIYVKSGSSFIPFLIRKRIVVSH